MAWHYGDPLGEQRIAEGVGGFDVTLPFGNTELGSVMDQVRNMMLVTVWVFIGIDGAAVYSQRAAKRAAKRWRRRR